MRQYIVNTFSDEVFGGSPVAVCIVESWIPSRDMMKIAIQNNLPETAFIINRGIYYELRSFSPYGELHKFVNSSLAAAYIVFRFLRPELNEINFRTSKVGIVLKRKYDRISLIIPQIKLFELETSYEVEAALGIMPKRIFGGAGVFFVFENEEQVMDFNPNIDKIMELFNNEYSLPQRKNWRKHIDNLLSDDVDIFMESNEESILFSDLSFCITSISDEADCICRYFSSINYIMHGYEYPIKYETMLPYWFSEMKKNKIKIRQVDQRNALLECTNKFDTKIEISGKARLYAISDIYVE